MKTMRTDDGGYTNKLYPHEGVEPLPVRSESTGSAVIGKIDWQACYSCGNYTEPGCTHGFENIIVDVSIETEEVKCGFYKPNVTNESQREC